MCGATWRGLRFPHLFSPKTKENVCMLTYTIYRCYRKDSCISAVYFWCQEWTHKPGLLFASQVLVAFCGVSLFQSSQWNAPPSLLLSALITVMSYVELLTAAAMLVTIDKAQGHLSCPATSLVHECLCPRSSSFGVRCGLILETLFSDFKIPAGLPLAHPDLYCPCGASSHAWHAKASSYLMVSWELHPVTGCGDERQHKGKHLSQITSISHSLLWALERKLGFSYFFRVDRILLASLFEEEQQKR